MPFRINEDVLEEVLEDLAHFRGRIDEVAPLVGLGLLIGSGILVDKSANKLGQLAGKKAAERELKRKLEMERLKAIRSANAPVSGNPNYTTNL